MGAYRRHCQPDVDACPMKATSAWRLSAGNGVEVWSSWDLVYGPREAGTDYGLGIFETALFVCTLFRELRSGYIASLFELREARTRQDIINMFAKDGNAL